MHETTVQIKNDGSVLSHLSQHAVQPGAHGTDGRDVSADDIESTLAQNIIH